MPSHFMLALSAVRTAGVGFGGAGAAVAAVPAAAPVAPAAFTSAACTSPGWRFVVWIMDWMRLSGMPALRHWMMSSAESA
jgi:hypothetical protein